MAELPFLPIATDALIADTTHMTAEQFGAYVRLLVAMWRNGAELPDSGAELARIAGVSSKRWDAIAEPVLRPVTKTDGKLTQKRLSATWNKVQRKRLKMSAAANERWQRKRNYTNAYANGYANGMHTHHVHAYANAMLTKTKIDITTTSLDAARAKGHPENPPANLAEPPQGFAMEERPPGITRADGLAEVIAKKGWVS